MYIYIYYLCVCVFGFLVHPCWVAVCRTSLTLHVASAQDSRLPPCSSALLSWPHPHQLHRRVARKLHKKQTPPLKKKSHQVFVGQPLDGLFLVGVFPKSLKDFIAKNGWKGIIVCVLFVFWFQKMMYKYIYISKSVGGERCLLSLFKECLQENVICSLDEGPKGQKLKPQFWST